MNVFSRSICSRITNKSTARLILLFLLQCKYIFSEKYNNTNPVPYITRFWMKTSFRRKHILIRHANPRRKLQKIHNTIALPSTLVLQNQVKKFRFPDDNLFHNQPVKIEIDKCILTHKNSPFYTGILICGH